MAPNRSFLAQPLLLMAMIPSINRNAMAFVPQSYSTRSTTISKTRMALMVGPQEMAEHIQVASDLMNIAGDHHVTVATTDAIHSSSLLSSVSAAVAQKSQFNFLGIPFGGAPDPYLNGQSIPPRLDGSTVDAVSSVAKQVSTQLSSASSTQQAVATYAPVIEEITDKTPLEAIDNIPKIELTRQDLQFLARSSDIAARIPTAMILYVLFDFFFLSADNDIYKEEIDEDAPGVLVESLFTMASRVGVIFMFVLATMATSFAFYHPDI
mmetsp:Transcript_6443/g.9545  ORF Transcript_6443/g.9545 Transcript_6443/m.9545 type:complete len:266 (+) Transcript_6443:128-925(+)